ncbi:MAG: hypothetical protein GWP19_10410 [Planctomycetia bacterium]|nr:hypothetical protein [Planctomycetia bacterium]
MSQSENKFIKWFASIAGALIIASILGLFGMYRSQIIIEQKFDQQEETNTTLNNRINTTRVYHSKDVALIRDDIKEIKNSQAETQKDIKTILLKLK